MLPRFRKSKTEHGGQSRGWIPIFLRLVLPLGIVASVAVLSSSCDQIPSEIYIQNQLDEPITLTLRHTSQWMELDVANDWRAHVPTFTTRTFRFPDIGASEAGKTLGGAPGDVFDLTVKGKDSGITVTRRFSLSELRQSGALQRHSLVHGSDHFLVICTDRDIVFAWHPRRKHLRRDRLEVTPRSLKSQEDTQ